MLPDRFAAAQTLLRQGVGSVYPACALLFADSGQIELLTRAGSATPPTWWDLASVTKALCTSILCMRLCERGALGLDQQPLPGATVRHLLCHASGLPAWRPLYQEVTGVPEGPARRAAVVALAASAERGPAGSRSVYSDLGFILLGHLIEERGGARLDQQFAELAEALEADVAFRPLPCLGGPLEAVDARRCAPTRRETPLRELLQGEVHDDNARAMGGVAGHAGLFGTPEGVSRMIAALVDVHEGRQSAPARALGLRQATVQEFFRKVGVAGSTWGLGWDHPTPLGAGTSSAGSRWSRDGVGHLGYTGCSVWIEPAAGRWAVLLTNRVAAETPAEAAESQARLKVLRPLLHDALLEGAASANR